MVLGRRILQYIDVHIRQYLVVYMEMETRIWSPKRRKLELSVHTLKFIFSSSKPEHGSFKVRYGGHFDCNYKSFFVGYLLNIV